MDKIACAFEGDPYGRLTPPFGGTDFRQQSAPSDYLGRFHYDCCTYSGQVLRFLIDTVGIDQVVLGTDYPAPSIRSSLSPSGHYVCLDINCSDKIEENTGPLATYFRGASLTYCMTSSLADNGAGLGTLAFHEHEVYEMCREAGFANVQRVEIENPFNNLYLAAP